MEEAKREGDSLIYQKKYNLFQRIYKLPYLLGKYAYTQMCESIISKDKRIGYFLSNHKDLLIIICDPKTDKLMMSYRDKVVINKIKSATGLKTNIVKKVLKHSTFKRYIDQFIASLVESLDLSIKDGNLFWQWIDGALFNITKAFAKTKKEDYKP